MGTKTAKATTDKQARVYYTMRTMLAGNLRRLKMVSAATGISVEELVNTSITTALPRMEKAAGVVVRETLEG